MYRNNKKISIYIVLKDIVTDKLCTEIIKKISIYIVLKDIVTDKICTEI
jgi:hypothetical protein